MERVFALGTTLIYLREGAMESVHTYPSRVSCAGQKRDMVSGARLIDRTELVQGAASS